jgi:hypothetical protein
MERMDLIRRLGAPVLAVALVSACATEVPPTAAPTSPPPPAASVVTALEYADQAGGGTELAPGTYVMSAGPLRLTFTVPSGWYKGSIEHVVWESGSNSSIGFSVAGNLYIDPCSTGKGLQEPAVGPTVADLVAALGELPGVSASGVSDVTVAGFTGKQVELTGTEAMDCDDGVLWDVGDSVAIGPGPGERLALRILDAAGARLVLSPHLRRGITPEAKAELEAIMESIRVVGP